MSLMLKIEGIERCTVYNADDSKKWFRPQKTPHASYKRKHTNNKTKSYQLKLEFLKT